MKCIHGVPFRSAAEQLADGEAGRDGGCLDCNPHGCASPWCTTNVAGHTCEPKVLRLNELYLRMIVHDEACVPCRGCPHCKNEWRPGRCAEGERLLAAWESTINE